MTRFILIMISAFGILIGATQSGHAAQRINPASAHQVIHAVAKNDNVKVIGEIANAPSEVRRELLCLALNIYHEARGSSMVDMLAVGLVTFNRLSQTTWETRQRTICDVVYQQSYSQVIGYTNGRPITRDVRSVQFSWTAYSLSRQIPSETESWDKSQKIAVFLLRNQDRIHDFTAGATHYYAPKTLKALGYKTPKWVKRGIGKQHIGEHVYMRFASK